ncbi:hypothetical protein HMPREF0864_04803 [Enterobacteriaceae bacterium 9_2_54FAA]|nr:hypothetical protein HMPREF0864_04803 [Enterobacteriaceae bacterium 9_2_54FAA]
MLTFKHFKDRPSWAAADGYDFNIIDCMSEAAGRINIWRGIVDAILEIPDFELREAWYRLPISLVAVAIALAWPLIFWIVGLDSYVKCIRNRRKYLNTKSEIVLYNLAVWRRECDRRIKRAQG